MGRSRVRLTDESFRRDSRWASVDSYSLVDDADELLGFGQISARCRRAHLSRLAVAPKHRGKGYGTALVKHLIARARETTSYRECSLYVYRDNTVAIHCYRREGFRETDAPRNDVPPPHCVYMVLPPGGPRAEDEA